ncbi:heme ABC exporter ATP-binding protein CcmA [Natroniella sp. ANB-PHB2]|uniref:heme ABC exporter ATP-binding protein CcmA n=1 Tax=Natroniella sp. ANB-PHB2 TaxID=3384444 RepID=UPI0038D51209
MKAKIALAVNNLKKKLNGKELLTGIDFNLTEGEILSIFGPNGAGKTTLLNLLSTATNPTTGRIEIMGQDIIEDSIIIKEQVGLISHETFFYDKLTAYENLEFYGKMYSITDLDNRIFRVIKEVGLKYCLHDFVATFSRGMKQRLAIARAILHLPKLLLLDEPYTGLDQHAIEMLNGIVKKLNEQGRTIVTVTHNLQQGLKISDQFLILIDGRIEFAANSQEFTTTELKEKYSGLLGGRL